MKHPEWLTEDNVHPNNAGTAAYAKLIHDRVLEKLTEDATKGK